MKLKSNQDNILQKLVRELVQQVEIYLLMNSSILLQSFHIRGSLFEKLANFGIALRWRRNTIKFHVYTGKPPNYVNPSCWTEKMQWRKLCDRNPLFRIFCDKIGVREFVRNKTPEISFPKFLWIGDNPDSMPFHSFTCPYVIKPNHRSGNVLFIRNYNDIDKQEIISVCRNWLSRKYHGYSAGEWAYKQIKGKILVEEYLSADDNNPEITNYKFFVFSGYVRFVQFESKCVDGLRLTFFNREGERLPVRKWTGAKPRSRMAPPSLSVRPPGNYNKMVRLAEKLGESIDHIRVDLYNVNGRIYLSELTPYDGTGYSYLYNEDEIFDFYPSHDLNIYYGSSWNLPAISRTRQLINALLG